MESGSSRTRIDQFFTSRKKKSLSPSQKAEKVDKDIKSTLDGSPSAKGTLDSYLVNAHEQKLLVKPSHTDHNLLSRQDPVKRNLTLEINLSSEVTQKSFFPLNNLGNRDHSQKVEDLGEFHDGPLCKISAKEIVPNEHSLVVRRSCEVGEVATQAPVEETISITTSGKENLELKQFASDFLSLYCSELPSNLSSPSEQKWKGHKRNGSPSLLVANSKTCMKKQCVSDKDLSLPDVENIHPDQQYPENFKPELDGKPVEAVVHSGELEETGDKTDKESGSGCIEVYAALRKCNRTPNSSSSMTKCYTPGPSADVRSGETPIWARRSSMFSPGDAFWNEAFQVVDGLYAPVDEFSVQLGEGLNVINGQFEEENFCSSKKERCGDMLLNDRSSYPITPQYAQNALKSAAGEGEAICLEMKASVDSIEKADEKIGKLSTVISDKETSPLPVRHFDFLHEEKNMDENAQTRCFLDEKNDISHKGVGSSDISSVNRKGLQTSSILTRCRKAEEIKEYKSEEKLCSSLSITLGISQGFHSSPGSREKCQVTENVSILLEADGKMSKKNHIENIDGDKALSLGPPGTSNEKVNVPETAIKTPIVSYNQGHEAGTPSSSMHLKDSLQLSSWLPSELCSIYMKRGISKLYPWQVDCLQVDGVLQIRNLVYCASTSAGKSFVAEILMLRRIISTEKMALLVLPYVSLCSEKAEHLEVLLEPLGKHVRSFYGNQGGGTLPKDTSVAVCTIEKANYLVNRLLEEGRLSEVGIIVIDELHMVGDQSRGYLLELMLTKLRYAAGEGNSESCSGDTSGSSSGKSDPAHGLQIVGMSATMPNVAAVADWLKAALYETDFRPVPLEEYVKVGNTIFNKKMNVVRTIPKTADLGGKDPDHIVELCNEVVQEGHSVLVFCSSRKGCESTAKHVSKFLKNFNFSTREGFCEFSDASSAIEALRRCPAGLDPVLEETLPSGVAYHHAGLTLEEREIVETCYRKGLVRVLTATSTLAAGVNLPARRVIFRQPRIGCDFLDGTRYRQMAGRAGRTGIDTRGESILVCKPEEVKRISAVLNDNCPPLQSCLAEDKNGMTHAILEVVAGGIVQTASDIHRYVRCTLLNSTKPFEDVVKSAQDSLRWLGHRKFLEWNEETKLYSTTPLGRASFGSSLSPEESLVVLDDLSRAREGFVLASDLHLVYLVTPINVDVEPDWELYYQRFMELSALEQSVGNRVGVAEPFLMRMAHGAPMPIQDKSRGYNKGLRGVSQNRNLMSNNNILSDERTLRVCKRFYVALMLSRLVQEVPVSNVCEAFKVARGMVQSLQENAGRFALMVSLFCERLGWHDMEVLVAKFQNRVSFGVRAEIVELTTIPYVKGSRARALYKAGLRTPLTIAEASLPEIVKAIFESSSWAVQEGSAMRRVQLGVAKKIKNGARKLVLDQAEEARVAAFTTFKSLGVLVPQFSGPSLSTAIRDPIMQEVVQSSSSGDTPSNCDAKQPNKDTQLPSKLSVDDTDKQRKDFSLDVGGEKADKSSDNSDGAGGVNSIKAMHYNCNAGNSLISVGGSALTHGPNAKLIANNTENSGETPFLKSGNTEIVDNRLGGVPDHKHGEGCGRKNNILNSSNVSISENGPINASSTPGGFDSFLDLWDAINEFYFDVHFTKRSEWKSPMLFEIHGMALCWENSPVYYINFSKDLVSSEKINLTSKYNDFSGTSGNITKVVAPNQWWEIAKHRWNRIAMIMGRTDVRKITWNLKTQIQVLKNPGFSIQRFGGLSFEQKEMSDIELINNSFILLPSISVQDGIDICIAAWMLWPDEESRSNPNIEKEVKKRLSTDAAAAANRDGRWRNQMRRAAHNGCCRRVAQTRALGSVLWKLLISENLVDALTRIENPLVKVLADMELWGIGVDMEACLRARHILGKKLNGLEKEAYNLAGMTFSLYAAADIANVLYRHLKLPIPDGCNKGKQHPSTDKHSLDLLRDQHPIVSVIKEHRTLAKLLNSTLGSICSQSKLCVRTQKYKIQGHWLQTSTATGRISMEEPNLQCVEHTVDFTIHHIDKNNSSSSDTEHHQINARDLFIPTQDNWLLLTADYSQIELRLMAHFSKDSSLIELLSKPDGDVFTMITARWTGQLESAINSKERDQTKRLVYGILYGMGVNTLAEQLDCSSDEAREKMQSFKSSFPGVSVWLNEAVESCRHKGYVETLKGRKRFISKIKLGNSKEKAKAQRQAVNSICQGSAADIIKIAMVNLHTVIVEGCEATNSSTSLAAQFSMLKGRCRILLQVHDELLLEVDPSVVREAALLLQMSMENAVSLCVPLLAKLKIGRTWGSLELFHAESYAEKVPVHHT